MAVECPDVRSNSSLELSSFDLSTPGYDLSNKVRRGLGNHDLVNKSVLRQQTSRTTASDQGLQCLPRIFQNVIRVYSVCTIYRNFYKTYNKTYPDNLLFEVDRPNGLK